MQTFELTGDFLPPTVWAQTPWGLETGLIDTVELEFSEPLDAGTLAVDAFSISGPTDVEVASQSLSSAGNTVTLTLLGAVDASLGAFQLSAAETVQDAAGNALAGTWAGVAAPYVGVFGVVSTTASPVADCAVDAPAFTPDGDDGAGAEADAVNVSFSSASAPERWMITVTGEGAVPLRRDFPTPIAESDQWSWDGRDESEGVVPSGLVTIAVDSLDEFGNRGGSCSISVSVTQHARE
jgi:hypothetical protein